MYAEEMNDARKIINDDVIKFIEEFKNETKYKFEFMINKELVFFRFFDNEILTKPIANDKETKEYLYKYYRIIEFLSEFIEKIEK